LALGWLVALAVLGLVVNRYIPVLSAWHALVGNESRVCRIKGNISTGGERIYHVPGQRYYGATRIDVLKGERWFCSEAEARAAGWRRALK